MVPEADMENRKFQSLWEALEEVQDDVEGGDFGLDSMLSLLVSLQDYASLGMP